MTYRPLDRTDWRIMGKLRACERRKKVFNPGLQLIADDLSMCKQTVWRRLYKLAAYGLVAIWKMPRGFRYIWRTARFYLGRKPYEHRQTVTHHPTGEYQTLQKHRPCQPSYDTTSPEGVIALELHKLGARSQAPPGERPRRLRAIAAKLVREGMTIEGFRALVKAAHFRVGLLMHWLGKQGRWRNAELDIIGRHKHQAAVERRRKAEREHVTIWKDGRPVVEKQDLSLQAMLDNMRIQP